MSALSSLMNRMQNTTSLAENATKMRRTEIVGHPLLDFVYQNLCQAWSLIQANDKYSPDKIELEFRIGMLVARSIERYRPEFCRSNDLSCLPVDGASADFRAGVDESFLKGHLAGIFTQENGFISTEEPLCRLRTCDTGPRWEANDNGEAVALVEQKKRLNRINLSLLNHDYDVRMDLAVEVQHPLPKDFDSRVWTCERLKKRVSYVHNKFFHWKIDCTEVDVQNRTGDNLQTITRSREYEVEFELSSPTVLKWAGMVDVSEAHLFAQEIAQSIVGLLNICIPHESDPLTVPGLEDVTGSYRDLVVDLNQKVLESSNPSSFPGSLPYNMSRRSLSLLIDNEYYLTEKSDGIRYLLYVVATSHGPEAIFVDRSGSIYRAPGSKRLGYYLGVNTIVDGEIVFNRSYRRPMFLIFDILAMEGKSYLSKPFNLRLHALNGSVNERIETYLTKNASDPNCLLALRKKYFRKNELGNLLRWMTVEEGHRVYREGDRRHHKSDGLILQPNTSYKFFSDEELLKWKWPELRSVDLQVTMTTESIALNSIAKEGNSQVLVDVTRRGSTSVGLAKYDSFRLRGDIRQWNPPMSNPIIAEFIYDTDFGQWRYCKLRKDKNRPNYISVVMNVLMEQAENVTIEELETCLLGGEAQNQFQIRMAKAREEIIRTLRS